MLPMVDLQRQYRLLKPEIDAVLRDVLEHCQFILGPNVSALEKEVAAYHGIEFGIGVANGTDALLLALQACNIREGDEVITTPFTFIATAEVIAQLKAVPVFTDIDPFTFNMDPSGIEAAISTRTKAIMPVHLFGLAADMDPILELARKHGLKVIEDCAQAFGAEYNGKKVGTMGDCGCFSFFPSKNLACYGDGGMIITGDPGIAERIGMLRNHGSRKRYYHEILGWNSRLDEIQAAILRVKLKRIDQFNASRRQAAGLYRKYIERSDFLLPREVPGSQHVYHQFTVRTRQRDHIAARLLENGISSAIYYPVALHRQGVFSELSSSRSSAEGGFSTASNAPKKVFLASHVSRAPGG